MGSIRKSARWVLPMFLTGSLLALWVFREPLLVMLGEFLIRSETPQKADLIYVLAGDFWGSRVLVGSELGARGYAPHVLFSGGLYADAYEGDMSARFAVEHGYPEHLFLAVPLHARSTVEEAMELQPVFQRLHAKRVILVTTDFHSRRAALVFRLFVPGVQFYVVAAPDKVFDATTWWKTDSGRRLCFAEYSKMLGTLITRAEAW